ncbi:Protein lin-2 [Toxocara canis]|uniref:Protein lin-2 n=1 Tax=Toxocara canis TaxID=6265 RepID=A0A0B2UW51_TOXCA|nr:Protein lin-2 [Toxocara canis]
MSSSAQWTHSEEAALLAHHYQIGDLIERGPLSTVYRAVHRTSSKLFTVKSIDLQKYTANSGLTRDDVDKEIEICAQLKHSFLCELKDVIAGEKAVHMVFEFLDGDDICFEIVKRASAGFVYSEAVASHYMKQLMLALQYMHSQGIVHRDIRPHNVVLASKDNSAPLKLSGFGVALKLDSPDSIVLGGCHYMKQLMLALQYMHSQGIVHRDIRPHNVVLASKDNSAPLKLSGFGVALKLDSPDSIVLGGRVGTPQFMAPEVVSNVEYGTKADMWSAGVLLYILLCGRLPFVGSRRKIYESITEGRYSHHGGTWQSISNSAKDLLIRLLTVDPHKRISAEEALNHEWIRERDRAAPKKHLQSTVEQIRRYNSRRKLKSNILATVNNEKWLMNSSSPHESTCSVLSGDTLPGGDTCDADGCTRRGPEQTMPDDLNGVEKILTSLDQIATLSDPPFTAEPVDQSPDGLLDDPGLRNLLLVSAAQVICEPFKAKLLTLFFFLISATAYVHLETGA